MQMVELISPMGLIFVSWLLLFLMFSGLGLFVQRFLNQHITSGTLWLDAFWLGWALSLLILQLWHFVFPVNELILAIFMLIGFLSLVVHRHQLLPIIRRLKQYRVFIVIFSLLILWLSNRAIDMPTAFDTGFRDIQAVMWIDTYPIVPGLNNLFASLAFNQSVYLYDALLDASIWSGRAYHIATGLLLVVFLAHATWSAVQLFHHRDGQGLRWSWILLTLLIPYILFDTIRRGAITHYLTDTPVDLIGFLCVAFVIDFIQFYRVNEPPNTYPIVKIAILIVTGFTLKQSFIVFGLGLGVLVFIVWIGRGGFRCGVMGFLRIILLVIIYGLLMCVPWMARGVVTSGYIAYPQSFGRFEVDWAESPKLIAERQEMLATNTRIRYGDSDEVLSSWDWVRPWLRDSISNLFEFSVPVSLSLLLMILYGVGRFRHRTEQFELSIGVWVLLPMLVMMVVWFLSAPNIKYIKYILWINVAVLAILNLLVWSEIKWQWRIYSVLSVLMIGLLYIAYLIVAMRGFPLVAGSDNGFYVRPMPPIKIVEIQNGATINTPDSHIKQCWDIPLPCTPTARTRIFERVPGDLRHGFGLVPKDTS
jgi:hypothetical protein